MGATVIDALIVTMGLDAKGMKKGGKDVVETYDKVDKAAEKSRKNAEREHAKVALSIEKVRNGVLSLLAAFTAGSGLKSFFNQMTATDAAAGRMAKNLDMTASELTIWQGVAERAGGSSAGITNSIQNLVQAGQQLALTGQSDVIPYFKALHIQFADSQGKMRPVADLFKDLAKAFHDMDPAKAQAIGAGMHLDEGTVNVLMQGSDALERLLAAQKELGYANEKDTASAIARASALTALKQKSEDLGRKVLTELTPAIIAFTNALTAMGVWLGNHTGVFDGLIAGIGAVSVALTAMAGQGLLKGVLGSLAGVAKSGALVVAAGAIGYAIGSAINDAFINGTSFGDWIGKKVTQVAAFFGVQEAKDALAHPAPEGAPTRASGDRSVPRGIRNNNPGNLNYAGQEGATKETGPNGRFAVFGSMKDGIVALAKQLERYASRNIDSIESIISLYAPKGENNTHAYIMALAKKLGVSPNAHLNVKDQGTMEALINGIGGIENGAGRLNAQQVHAALSARNGASNTSNSATTHIGEINIQTAATDSKGIAQGISPAISDAQKRAAMANYGPN